MGNSCGLRIPGEKKHDDMDCMDRSFPRRVRPWHRHLGTREGLVIMSNPLARFLIGGLVGFAWERKFAPRLKGATRFPFRPIYGCGAVLSGQNFTENCYRATVLEALAHGKRKDLWCYDIRNPMTLTEGVRGDYMVAFGSAMTIANKLFDLLKL